LASAFPLRKRMVSRHRPSKRGSTSYLSFGFGVSSARRWTGDDRSGTGAAGGVACVLGTHIFLSSCAELVAHAVC